MAGTNILGMLVALGIVLAGSAVFLWRKNRSEMRSVLGDLRTPKK
jgi:LPXTG-motif cell wall-anchored protein